MDEGQLSGLFAEAAEQAGRDAPPPSFDHEAVLASSARAAARVRRWQTGVVAVAVIVVAGTGLVGVQRLATGPSTSSTLAQRAPSATPTVAQRAAPERSPGTFGTFAAPNQAVPDVKPREPGTSPSAPRVEQAPGTMPRRDGTAPVPYGARPAPLDARARPAPEMCGPPDTGLFDQVAAVLPAVRGSVAQPLGGVPHCPTGARAIQIPVNDHGAAGILRVLLVPAGAPGGAAPGGTAPGGTAPGGTASGQGGEVRIADARTPRGDRITVWASAAGLGRVPYAGQLPDLARALAAHNP